MTLRIPPPAQHDSMWPSPPSAKHEVDLASASSEIGDIGQVRPSGCSDMDSSARRNLATTNIVAVLRCFLHPSIQTEDNSCEFKDLDGLLRSDLNS